MMIMMLYIFLSGYFGITKCFPCSFQMVIVSSELNYVKYLGKKIEERQSSSLNQLKARESLKNVSFFDSIWVVC